MSLYRLQILHVEIYKVINKLNQEFLNNIFEVKKNKKLVGEQYKLEQAWIFWMEPGYFLNKIFEITGTKNLEQSYFSHKII